MKIKKAILIESLLQTFFFLCRRSANAVLVRELQAKVDKGENIEFELQVKKLLFETEIFTKILTVSGFC
jgi:hypothetical protein